MRTPFLTGLTILGIATGAVFYPGELLNYFFFSIVFFAVLYSGLFLSFQYSHFFFAIAWFLGFWPKLVLHFVFNHLGLTEAARYVEPAGSFDGSSAAWDNVLLTAAIGGLGYLAGRLVCRPAVSRTNSSTDELAAPRWYPRYRSLLWISACAVLLAILFTNAQMGLIVRGYVPRIQLPWPLGGLFSWTTDIGFALAISVLATWDCAVGAGLTRGFIALCIEGAILSVATNSRGIYLFHTLPPLVSEARAPAPSQFGRVSLLLVVWFAGAVTIPILTSGLRALGERVVLANVETGQSSPLTNPTVLQPPRKIDAEPGSSTPAASNEPSRKELLRAFFKFAFPEAGKLLIDRWTGLEGVMSVASYPQRGISLLREAALERRTFGMVDIYTSKISGSPFTVEQTKKYHNATLAGPIAFFYLFRIIVDSLRGDGIAGGI